MVIMMTMIMNWRFFSVLDPKVGNLRQIKKFFRHLFKEMESQKRTLEICSDKKFRTPRLGVGMGIAPVFGDALS